MESDKYANKARLNESSEWYTEEFVYNCLIEHLKKNGYKIHEEKPKSLTVKSEMVITVSKFFTKEIIGIKGLQPGVTRISLLKESEKTASSPQAKNWFSETLFNSLINFGKYYSDENAIGAMALPDVERYRAIIEKLHDYFTLNDLYFKLYMINEAGEVEVFDLNENSVK